MPHSVPTTDRPPVFDRIRCRYDRDGRAVVLFSHHHAIQLARLAQERSICDGAEILRRTASRTFLPILQEEIARQNAISLAERWDVCRSYWAWCGLGELRAVQLEPDGARVEMSRSQLDEGWLRVWGATTQPVNLLTQGFLAAVWAAIHEADPASFEVEETESLARGARQSTFQVRRSSRGRDDL